MLLVGIAQECRRDADAVKSVARQSTVGVALAEVLHTGKVAECRHKVIECKLQVACCASLNASGPPCYERNAYATLVALALQSAQFAVATEVFGIGTALLVRSVVACEDDESVLVESLLFQFGHHFTYVRVQTGYHSGEMGVCMLYGIIARAFLTAPSLVDEELLLVAFEYLVVGLSQLGMGQSVGEEAHKRMLGILTVNPLQSLVVYHTCRVLGALEVVLAEHRILDVLLHHLTHNGSVTLRA